MLNRSASLAMSTSVLKALPGKLDIKRHLPSILYVYIQYLSQSSMLCFQIAVNMSDNIKVAIRVRQLIEK